MISKAIKHQEYQVGETDCRAGATCKVPTLLLLGRGSVRGYLLCAWKCRIIQILEYLRDNLHTAVEEALPILQVVRLAEIALRAGMTDRSHRNHRDLTVAKTVSYPMQSSAIHTIAGKQPWAVTIGGRLKHANQDSNRFFPIESGEHGGSSAATATPNRWPYRSPA